MFFNMLTLHELQIYGDARRSWIDRFSAFEPVLLKMVRYPSKLSILDFPDS